MSINKPFVLALALASMMGVAACGDDDEGSSGGSASSTPAETTTTAAASGLDQYYEPLSEEVKGGPIKGVEKAKGKKFVYVPSFAQVPKYVTIYEGLKAAASDVGASFTQCDGVGTPAGATDCMNRASNQGADVIFTSAIPLDVAPAGYKAAKDAGIPVVLLDETEPSDPDPTTAYVRQDIPLWGQLIGEYIAEQSGSDANVLLLEAKVNTETTANADKLIEACEGCKVDRVPVIQTEFPKIPSITSSALLKNPDANWVVPQFSVMQPAADQGLKSAGKASKVRGAVSDAGPVALDAIKSGDGFIEFTAGASSYWEGYLGVDQALRLLTGTEPLRGEDSILPNRAFTKDTLADVDISNAAKNDLSTFVDDPDALISAFHENWGLGS